MVSSFVISMFYLFLARPHEEHKFYVSTTEIDYKTELNTLQITIQLFIDDAELLLQQSESSLRLDPDFNPSQVESLLGAALKKTLIIRTNNKSLTFNFLGKEYKNDIVQCYLEIVLQEPLKNIEIENTLFFNMFDEQQNIIHFKSPKGRKSFLLHRQNTKVNISL